MWTGSTATCSCTRWARARPAAAPTAAPPAPVPATARGRASGERRPCGGGRLGALPARRRAATLGEAIRLHGGQGRDAARAFDALPADQKASLLTFLQALRALTVRFFPRCGFAGGQDGPPGSRARPGGPRISPGVCAPDGDPLTVCRAKPGGDRPWEFAAREGHGLLPLKRLEAKWPGSAHRPVAAPRARGKAAEGSA